MMRMTNEDDDDNTVSMVVYSTLFHFHLLYYPRSLLALPGPIVLSPTDLGITNSLDLATNYY